MYQSHYENTHVLNRCKEIPNFITNVNLRTRQWVSRFKQRTISWRGPVIVTSQNVAKLLLLF